MKTGKATYAVECGSRCVVVCDASFYVYGYVKGNSSPAALLGPDSDQDRKCVFLVPSGVHQVEVRCRDRARHVFTETKKPPKEELDPTPVEVPIGMTKRAPSLHDDMKRFIREEMSRAAAEAGFESLEESDDFELDEDPDPVSRYELSEMQEEAIWPEDPDPPAEDRAKAPAKSGEGPEAEEAEPATAAAE